MSMTIQDDFWVAAQQLPEDQRAEFIYAAVRYGFDGEEPDGTPLWLPVFTVIKDRIRLSSEKSERGKKLAEKRWGKEKVPSSSRMDAGDVSTHYADEYNTHHAGDNAAHDACDMPTHDAENESENENEIPPYSPPIDSHRCVSIQDAPFWLQCLGALNEVLGATYTTMPKSCQHMLERSSAKYTVDEVRAMVVFKQKDWKDTRWKTSLTPNTLFSPDHFEQYMHQSKGDKDKEADYAVYDNF